MQPSDVEAFRLALKSDENVHAYCRTGNRSSQIWQAAQESFPETASIAQDNKATAQYDVVVVGAGSAGIATAASLLKRKPSLKICLIDPAESHFYQPGWTHWLAVVFLKRPAHAVTWRM